MSQVACQALLYLNRMFAFICSIIKRTNSFDGGILSGEQALAKQQAGATKFIVV